MRLGRILATAAITVLLLSEVILLISLAFFPYLPDLGFALINSTVYTFLAPLSPALLLCLLYAWVIRLVVRQTRRHSLRFDRLTLFLSEPFRRSLSSIRTTSLSDGSNLKILSHSRLLLVISVSICILLTYLPYRPDLNPTGTLVGMDSPTYVYWINQMLARSFPGALQYSFVGGLEGSRPILLMILYFLASAGASTLLAIEYMPIVLASLVSLSTYILVRYGLGKAALAGLASVFSPISYYTTIGLWGGYYANWLALVFVNLFMASLLIFSKRPSRLVYASMYTISLAIFLTHPWTWALILTVCFIYAVTVWRETGAPIHVWSIVALVISGVGLDLVKSLAFKTRTVVVDLATKSPSGAGALLGFWNNLVQALLYTHGGLMADWLVLGLGFLAVYELRFRDSFERLVLLWIAVPSLPFLVLDSYTQARIVYDLPFPILMAAATVYLAKLIETFGRSWRWMILVLFVAAILAHAMQNIFLL